MNKSFEKIFEEIEFLLKNYSRELRASTQLYRVEMEREKSFDYPYNPEDSNIRESLIVCFHAHVHEC